MTKTNMNINGERMPRFCGKEEKHKNSIIAKIRKNLKIINVKFGKNLNYGVTRNICRIDEDQSAINSRYRE